MLLLYVYRCLCALFTYRTIIQTNKKQPNTKHRTTQMIKHVVLEAWGYVDRAPSNNLLVCQKGVDVR